MKYKIIISILCTSALWSMQDLKQKISNMPLRQKIAQLMVVAAVSNEERNKDFMATQPYTMHKEYIEKLIQEYSIGGVIFLGTSFTDELKNRIGHFQSLSKSPLLIALDAEWPAMRLKNLETSLQLPHHMTLGALSDLSLVEEVGFVTGILLKKLGVHINLAPVADVNNNSENPVINDRSFGANPHKVSKCVIAYANGLKRAGIIGCAKHFPGHGDTKKDSHDETPTIPHDRARLDAIELCPFRAAIANGIQAIMTAHLQVPHLEPQQNTPATISKKITTDLLRKELGFSGVIFTDGLGMKGITDYYQSGQMEILALQAGADIPLCPVDPIKAIHAIEQAVLDGKISQEEINQKVLRVLQLKAQYKKDDVHQISGESLCTQSLALKKKIYEQAITIAKDVYKSGPETIIEINGMNKFKNQQFGISNEILARLKECKQDKRKVTVVLYGSPYAIDLINQYADRIIVAYEDDSCAHEAVKKILDGSLQAQGILPV